VQQLALFDTLPESPRPVGTAKTVRPASHPARIDTLAARLPANILLGTSSWSFPGWSGLVYAEPSPRQALARNGLSAYAAHPLLRTVGVDSGFYAPLDRRRLADYATQVPVGFRFLVKAPARITDRFRRDGAGRPLGLNTGFLDPALAADEAVAPFVEGLGENAGVLLLQLPPLGREITAHPRRFAEDLYRFLIRLPQGPCYAVELRDAALLTSDLAAALDHGGAEPGLAVHPRLPPIAEQLALFDPSQRPAAPLIIRWLLRGNRRYSEARERYQPFNRLAEPDPGTRGHIVEALRRAVTAGRLVYVIANNKAEGSAPLTLITLAETLLDG